MMKMLCLLNLNKPLCGQHLVKCMVREITSSQNPLVKYLVRIRDDRDYRLKSQSVLLEGGKLIEEVSQFHPVKKLLLLNTDSALTFLKSIKADEVFTVNESVMGKISSLHSSDGCLAEVLMPPSASLNGLKRIFACDGVSDPGNLGSLLRSGLALGWDGAFILENSCDPFNDKAIRSAKGATFRLPIASGSWSDLKKIVQQNNLHPWVGDIQGTPVDKIPGRNPILLVLCNEARGPSPEALRLCKQVTIPISSFMESLNVAAAGAILMYILGKQHD